MRRRAALLSQHRKLLQASGVDPKVAEARGYSSARTSADLERLGFRGARRGSRPRSSSHPRRRGARAGYQIRPDRPAPTGTAAPRSTSARGLAARARRPPLDRRPPRRPEDPLIITEGARKADAAVSLGLAAVNLVGGVWAGGGPTTGAEDGAPGLDSVALNGRTVYLAFDSDVSEKREVHAALVRLRAFLESRGARVLVVYLPSGPTARRSGSTTSWPPGTRLRSS